MYIYIIYLYISTHPTSFFFSPKQGGGRYNKANKKTKTDKKRCCTKFNS